MKLHRRAFVASLLAAAACGAARAQWGDPPSPFAGDPNAPQWPARERFPLWPGRPPGAPAQLITPNWTMNGPKDARQLWVRGVPFPEVHVFRPTRPDGSALLVLPGGGYQFLSVQNEGLNAARRLNPKGITVFVLTYRLPREGWAEPPLAPLQDAIRAMRLIRSRAARLRIDPARLGVLGFSAGGHLAADLAVSHAQRVYAPVDSADRLSARPAYLGLIYPLTSLVDAGPNSRSAGQLLGPSVSEAQLRARSPVLHVTKDVAPSFLVHAVDDPIVAASNSVRWAHALTQAGVQVETHLFSEGGHGFGFGLAPELPGSHWPELFALWLRRHGG